MLWRFIVPKAAGRAALTVCALLVAAAAHAEPEETRSLNLRVGDQSSIPAAGVKSYSEGVPGIVELRLPRDAEQFVVLAKKPGTTTLLLFMLDGRELQYRIEVAAEVVETTRLIQVSAQDNVRLDVYFVQVSEDYGHALGIAWPGSVGGNARLNVGLDLQSGQLTGASLGIADQVLPRLDLAQHSGWARVMRQTAVVAQNGEKAQFHSGGEVNVPIQGALTAEVRSISYGSNVVVEPRFDGQTGRIELHVGAEITDLTDDAGTGVPGRHVAKLDTVVNLDLGKSLVLAGLDAESDARSRQGLPGLSRIPILGGLFGSHHRRGERIKNLLVIVPSVVQAVPMRERNVVEEMLQVYETFDGHVARAALPFAARGAVP